ncbi:MAG: mechanosensitive ion channel family protein [Roseobacter sp.]
MQQVYRMVAVFLFALVAALGTSASAQEAETATTPPALPSAEDIDGMVAQMSDQDVRAVLLEYLRTNAPDAVDANTGATFVDRVASTWEAFTRPATDALHKLPVLFSTQAEAVSNFTAFYSDAGGVLTLFGLMAFALLCGFAAELVAKRYVLALAEPQDSTRQNLRAALGYLFKRFMREILGLIVFFVMIRVVGRSILTPDQIAFAGPFVFHLIWLPRVAAAAMRFVLSPKRPDLRLVVLNDKLATFLQRGVIGLVFLQGLTLFVVKFNTTYGVEPGASRIGFWLDLSGYLLIIYVAWQVREGLRTMMLGDEADANQLDRSVSWYYPAYVMVVSVAMWALVTTLAGMEIYGPLLAGAHYVTLFLLLATPAFDTAIRGLVAHMVPDMSGDGPIAEQAYNSTKRSYVHIGRVLVAGAVIMLIARAWDVDIAGVIQDRPGLGDNLFAFLLTCLVGYLAYEAVTLWTNRRLAAEKTAASGEGDQEESEMGAGQSRMSTVLPLMQLIARSAVVVLFALLALGNLGVDITPLLAGAGVLGLAIGFGAQKLVADVVSGIFFLVDDAFRIGEYVDVGDVMGAVERISIRSMQLRHHRGAVHTIPYGEIQKLTNFSRDWVIVKLKFTVPFDTDPNVIKKVFKKIGQEMMEVPEFKDDFLQPFKSQGVFDIDDVGMIVRGKFMSKPGKQFMIRKEIYNRVRNAFADGGIEFARREVRIATPSSGGDDAEITPEQQAAIAAAAAIEASKPAT